MLVRDGVRLATDVYRPAGRGRFPVLLHRTPYGKSSGYTYRLLLNPIEAVSRGYAVAVQDCRGTYGSEGEAVPFVHEIDDAFDTLEWISGQPWSNGQTGPYGSSGLGITALGAAVSGHPSIKASVVYSAGLNWHNGFIYSGGAFELGFSVHWVRGFAGGKLGRWPADDPKRAKLARALRAANEDLPGAVAKLPLDSDDSWPMPLSPFYRDWLRHPAYDSYWQKLDHGRLLLKLTGPVLHVSGWYDNFLRGHLDFNDLLKKHPDERIRKESRFIVGPWSHSSYYTVIPTFAGDRDFGPDANGGPPVASEWVLGWFDRWLKGDESKHFEAPVRFFVMGEKKWRECAQWPPEHSVLDLHLHSAGNANSSSGDGRLEAAAPADEPPDSYLYDPLNPVPSVGGRVLHAELHGPAGVYDQAKVEERDDVLVYTSERLERVLTIAGPVRTQLHFATTAEDTDFTAKLVDVEPDGYCVNLAEGIARARYRLSRSKETFLEPGKPHELEIDLWDVAHSFKPGHRVRLEISSSNFPRFDRNLNSRVVPARGGPKDVRQATQTIFHDRGRPSRLQLTLVSWRD